MTILLATTGSNAIILALTALQRLEATRQFNSNFTAQRGFVLMAIAVIVVLMVILLASLYNRKNQKKKPAVQSFAEHAVRIGLSKRERQILQNIAKAAGIKRNESIFVMDSAFEHGAVKILEQTLLKKDSEKGAKLRTEVSFLREKLGFQKRFSASVGSISGSDKLSSRQIPVGKTVHISNQNAGDSSAIEAVVVENNEMELVVKLEIPIETIVGDTWRVRYYFGSSVWEFDSSVISCNDNILVFNQRDNVRLVNRRRFLRASVNRPAYIAHFPFIKTIVGNTPTSDDSSQEVQGQADDFTNVWKPPEFVPANISELAGPGLRIEAVMETSLEVNAGDKVLIVFRLDEGADRDRQQSGRAPRARVIQDVGEVRHIKSTKYGLSMAIELIGLSDTDVNELIRVTNAASLKANGTGQDFPGLLVDRRKVNGGTGQ